MSNGDVICPGTVTVDADIDSRWALSSFSGYSSISFAVSNQLTNYPTVNINRPIGWIDDDDFDAVVALPGGDTFLSIVPADAFVFNTLTAFHNQPFNYQDILESPTFPYTDKKGLANVFCGGDYLVKAGSASQVRDLGSLAPVTFNLAPGAYQISAEFSGTRCFAANKIPFASPYDDIYLKRRGLLNVQPEKKTITVTVVEDPTASLQYVSISNFITGETQPFEYTPGSINVLLLTLRNNGDLPVQINGISPATPNFQVVVGVVDQQTGQALPSVLQPGQTKTYVFPLKYTGAQPLSGTTNINLNIDAVSTEQNCGAQYPDADLSLTFTTTPGEETGDVYCNVVPASADITVDQSAGFNVRCYREGLYGEPDELLQNNECSSLAQWTTQGPIAGSITLSQPAVPGAFMFADIVATPREEGSGTLVATVNHPEGTVICDALINSLPPGQINQTGTCVLTPQYEVVTPGQNYVHVDIDCFVNNQPSSCQGVNWTVDGATVNYGTDAQLSLHINDDADFVTVSADVGNPEAVCQLAEPLTVEDRGICVLYPQYTTVTPGQSVAVDIFCYQGGEPAPCQRVIWTAEGAQVTQSTNSQATLLVNRGATEVTLNAGVDQPPVECSLAAPLNVEEGACALTPEQQFVSPGQSTYVNISCFLSGNPVACQGVDWMLTGGQTAQQTDSQVFFTVNPTATEVSLNADVTSPAVECALENPLGVGEGGGFCSITSDSPSLSQGQSSTVTVMCFEYQPRSIFPVEVPCTGISWDVNGPVNIIETNEKNQQVVIQATDDEGRISIIADVTDPDFTCALREGLNVTGEEGQYSCRIDPSLFNPTLHNARFDVQCYEGRAEVDCSALGFSEWDVTGFKEEEEYDDYAIVSFDNYYQGISGSVAYRIRDNGDVVAVCSADVYIPALSCLDFL